MGVHARRAARRTTPLVAAAAGIGTVAAMLASPTAAHAAGLVLDPSYGGRDDGIAIAGAISGNAAGLIPTRGVDAVDDGTERVVLGQEGTGQRRVTLTRFVTAGDDLDDTWGLDGQVLVTVPSGTTVSRLLLDSANTAFYVIGTNSAGLVVLKLSSTTGAPVGGFAGAPISPTAFGLAGSAPLNIVDAELQTTSGDDGLVIGINSVSAGGARTARVVRILENGGLDTTNFGGTSGYFVVPSATSLGGIAVRPSTATNPGNVVGTYQAPSATFGVLAADPGETSGDSGVFEIDDAGVLETAFDADGISDAFETNFAEDTSPTGGTTKQRWTDEVLGDLIPSGAIGDSVLVTGRTGGSTFVASLDAAGALDDSGFGRLGGTGTVATGGGGVTTWSTPCSGSRSHITATTNYVYVANRCSDEKIELSRIYPTGILDTDFNSGSSVWKADSPVTGAAVTVVNPATDILRFGTAGPNGADAASVQVRTAVGPISATVTPTSSTTVVAGAAVTLVASATGGVPTPTFRWERRGLPGVPGNSTLPYVTVQNSPKETISGSNGRSLRIMTSGDMDGWEYRAVAINPAGAAAASPVALTILGIAPTITRQPENQTGAIGHSVTFTAEASGDPTPEWSWQWQAPGSQIWNDITNGPNIEGANTPRLTVRNLTKEQSGTRYRAIATNEADSVFTNGLATLTVGVGSEPEEPGEKKAVWADYDADGESDVATFRPSDGSFNWPGQQEKFGKAGDKPVVGNFDDDAEFDMAVFSGGTWKVEGEAPVSHGRSSDTPVSGDFDGDEETDLTVFRPSNGTWYVKDGATVPYGTNGDIPVPADYDGDGDDEFAVFRPSNGTWYIKGVGNYKYGTRGDIPVRGDFDGDESDDIAVYRPSNGTWYFQGGSNLRFGRGTDTPFAGDFDGDGTTDVGVFRGSNAMWYFANGDDDIQFGKNGDQPLPR
ncbi:immunoglobulin domain-containing protein [Cryptosporangium aurantiacum]|uniref:Immunoglobulin domain-containing protein n=1 Tax=Cryptosporangium aurantiacum TaxID=134849 RepID=A0A1M7RJA3_9ACTN|nr:immunoglobulin domain-containing protein [Cryptosporangium aurantiacum]SHN46383.1 Immunoglobulin domain-containing protein [Cryptosporangium aurantiacum]